MKKGEVPLKIVPSTMWTFGVIFEKWVLIVLIKSNQFNQIQFLMKNPPTLGPTQGDA
jgi:hypothetical protein